MSDDYWNVPGELHRKLTLDTCAWRGSFVVLKYDQTPVPDWAKDAVVYYEANSATWITPSCSKTGRPSQKASKSKPETHKKRIYHIQACRMWLQAGPPRPDGAKTDASARMLILDLVFSRQRFDFPCVVNEFFIACNGYDLDENEEWSDLIKYNLRDMNDAEKKELGIPVDSSEPTPTATAKTRKRRASVTLQDAAKIVGRTERTIQAWEKGKGTPEGWPGRGDAMALAAWAHRGAEQKQLKRAIHNTWRGGTMERYAAPRTDEDDDG